MVKPALGRGLGALLGSPPAALKSGPSSDPALPAAAVPPGNTTDSVRHISLKQIQPCPFQPRKDFSEESLRELANSIKEQGVVQPLIVRQKGGEFELIAGERRWRAAQLLGLTDVPVIVREANDRTVLELALIENLQRENLNPLEEALGFGQLIDQFQLTQEEAAVRVGKSRAAVTNALRLLKLPVEVQEKIRSGLLSVGHAKVILGLSDSLDQRKAAEQVVLDGLNVRQTEQLVAQLQKKPPATEIGRPEILQPKRDTHAADLEDRLKQRLGTKVFFRYREGKGAVEIRFFSDSELERLLQILGIQMD